MKIYLVRHGQSRWQVEQDDADWNSSLTDLGKEQAGRLAYWLANGPSLDNGSRLEVHGLLSSPYIRARQTAEPISHSLQLPVQELEPLKEASFLVSDYLPRAESLARPVFGSVAAPRFTPDQIYADFKSQAEAALESLVDAADAGGGPVLAVSHGGLISTLLRLAAGSDAVSFWIYNVALHLIEWKRGRWHLVFLNLWDHLPAEMRTY